MNKFTRNKLSLIGLIILMAIAIFAIFAPLISPYNPNDLGSVPMEVPSINHFFGTDDYGRDIFSRAVFGARVSLSIGFISVLIATFIGSLFGMIAGYFGGKIDSIMMRFVDIALAFPSIFLLLTVQVMLKPSIFNVMIVIGLTSWMGAARLVRAEFLSIKERPYIESAKAIGASHLRIILRHILPNATAPIIVSGTLGIAGAILTESTLSFLGLGVQPPYSSWGNMLMDSQAYLRDAPWMAAFPGILILITVLCIYFVGEGIREALNPKSK